MTLKPLTPITGVTGNFGRNKKGLGRLSNATGVYKRPAPDFDPDPVYTEPSGGSGVGQVTLPDQFSLENTVRQPRVRRGADYKGDQYYTPDERPVDEPVVVPEPEPEPEPDPETPYDYAANGYTKMNLHRGYGDVFRARYGEDMTAAVAEWNRMHNRKGKEAVLDAEGNIWIRNIPKEAEVEPIRQAWIDLYATYGWNPALSKTLIDYFVNQGIWPDTTAPEPPRGETGGGYA